MRWTPILSMAAVAGSTLAVAAAAAAPPGLASMEAATADHCGAPPHPMGLHASMGGEPAWGPPPGPGHSFEAPLPPYLHGVTLTDDQQDRIFTIFHEQAPQARKLARSARKARADLRDLGMSEKYDESAARALADAASKADGELALMRVHADHEILALLTTEQRKRIGADAPGAGMAGRDAMNHGPECWR